MARCSNVPLPCSSDGDGVSPENLFLVGLLDGSVNALDPDTGATVWRYDSGSPMVSVQTPDTVVAGHTSTPTFFPGADGGLYHYNKEGGQLEVSVLSVHLRVRLS